MDYRIEIRKCNHEYEIIIAQKGKLYEIKDWFIKNWKYKCEANPEEIDFAVYQCVDDEVDYRLEYDELRDLGFIDKDEASKIVEEITDNVIKELNIRDKMIDMLCDVVERSDQRTYICECVNTEDCTFECKDCIKKIIRGKVGG